MTIMKCAMKKQAGFSLIEALVAFLLLSVGMLGIASLQAISLRSGYTATLRTVAVIKAEEILERMRANHTALLSYRSAAGTGTTAPSVDCSDASGTRISCLPVQMAPYDVYQWKQDVLSAFPANTTASIVIPDPADPLAQPQLPWSVTVTINWEERDPASKGAVIKMNYTTTQDICGVLSC